MSRPDEKPAKGTAAGKRAAENTEGERQANGEPSADQKTRLEEALKTRQEKLDAVVHEQHRTPTPSYHGRSAEGFVFFRGLRDPDGKKVAERASELFGQDGDEPRADGSPEDSAAEDERS